MKLQYFKDNLLMMSWMEMVLKLRLGNINIEGNLKIASNKVRENWHGVMGMCMMECGRMDNLMD